MNRQPERARSQPERARSQPEGTPADRRGPERAEADRRGPERAEADRRGPEPTGEDSSLPKRARDYDPWERAEVGRSQGRGRALPRTKGGCQASPLAATVGSLPCRPFPAQGQRSQRRHDRRPVTALRRTLVPTRGALLPSPDFPVRASGSFVLALPAGPESRDGPPGSALAPAPGCSSHRVRPRRTPSPPCERGRGW